MPRRRPVTPRGESTVQRLLEAATRAFSRRGFHRASVAEICRLSGVANGTFYQYFHNKEEVFVALTVETADRLIARLKGELSRLRAPLTERLVRAMESYWGFVTENAPLHQVLREAEFVRLDVLREFYSRLARLYSKALSSGSGASTKSPLDPDTTAYALLGIQEFLTLRYLLWSQDSFHSVVDTVRELLAHGLDGGGRRDKGPGHATPQAPEEGEGPGGEAGAGAERSAGERTRARILRAAEAEFGARGFHEASIADIARRAGVAHGTVYLYFPSKEALFAQLVCEINRQLRAHIRRRTQGLEDRREVEIAGFEAFFEFIAEHPQAYRIVREAEFVGTGEDKGRAGRWYYERLAQGYVRGLRAGMEAGQIRPLDPEVLAWALMGIGHFLGLRWIVWEGTLPPARARDTLRNFLLRGLSS